MSTKADQTIRRVLDMLHGRARKVAKGEPLAPPIINAAKYALPGAPDHPFPYGRFDNPGWQVIEDAIGALEDAPTICFPSGMAAVTAALMALAGPGARVLLPSDGYYTVRVLIEDFLRQHGVEPVLVPTRQMDDYDPSGLDLVWLETPSNPGLDVCDIKAICERAKIAGAKVCVDNTTATPLLQDPLALGADMVVASDTKALAGHSDVLFGHVASKDETLLERVRQWRKLSGATPGPAEAYLAYRGLMTLELRLERMCANADALARLLQGHTAASAVRFPGLETDPSYAIATIQMVRPGFVLGATFKSEETAERFIDDCPAIFHATSFGGIQTSGERRARWGDDVAPGYVRLSAGCEPTDALLTAVSQTLDTL
ncbi:MAG: cystathionine gamma-lyase [Henriciella sp.]|nr:cystathionine gamma-lyase [Henriciella sp.]